MKKNVIDLLGKTVRVKNEKQLRKLTKIARKQGFRFKNLNEAAMSKVFCFYEMFGAKIIEKPFIIFEENVTEFKDIFITPTKDDLLAERIKLQNKVIAMNGQVESINDKIVKIDNHKKMIENLKKLAETMQNMFKPKDRSVFVITDVSKEPDLKHEFSGTADWHNWTEAFLKSTQDAPYVQLCGRGMRIETNYDLKPNAGDICYFWDNNMNTIVIGKFKSEGKGQAVNFGCYIKGQTVYYQNCKKVTNSEVLELWEEQRAKQTDK